MNKETLTLRTLRYNTLINFINERNKIRMVKYQTVREDGFVVMSVKEFHTFDNEACIAGHLALLPLFHEAGGRVGIYGNPLNDVNDHLNIGADNVFSDFMLTFQGVSHLLVHSTNDNSSDDPFVAVHGWKLWKAPHAIKALEFLRDNPEVTLPEAVEYFNIIYE